jgi:hypothetical protein
MNCKGLAKTAFKDVYHWKYDPFFNVYYHEHTGVIFHEDMLTKWKWDVRVIPHQWFPSGVINPLLHWQLTKQVGWSFRLWWAVIRNLNKIERQAKWVCC